MELSNLTTCGYKKVGVGASLKVAPDELPPAVSA